MQVSPEGVVNVLKPPGMTSSNAVVDVRRLFHCKRVGHTGTLDPGAAGVLPVCLGRATRLFDLLVDKEKEYIAELSFGMCTDTQDSYGRVVAVSHGMVSQAQLEGILPAFLGEQQQLPPMYSALKKEGKALHQLAREGKEIPRELRNIRIDRLEILDMPAPNRFLLRVRCSRGTYVRTLCQDIGERLGQCAYMSFLLRSAAGPFQVEQAYSIHELEALQQQGRLMEAVMPIDEALGFLPAMELPDEQEALHARLLNGVPISQEQLGQINLPEGPLRVYVGGHFLGVGMLEGGKLRLKLHLVGLAK